jgi:uncharacterized protein YjeT (DUF2065 family)
MPDVHVPQIGEHSGKSIWHIALEVVLIGTGVFLGLMGEQWRERAHQRELAEQALRRFRVEIVENRKAVEAVKDYHVKLQKQLQTEYEKPAAKRSGNNIEFHGIRPSNFDHAAWDLALGTQSLAYIDSDLGVELSNIYNLQSRIAEMTRGVMESMYVAPPIDDRNTTTFMGAVMIYYGDMIIFEPRLLTMYDEALQRIDKSLGGT